MRHWRPLAMAITLVALAANGRTEASRAEDEKKLWFSDTYVRTPGGWRYAFGQASLSLPASP
jgi:hypothetical protein